MSLDVNPTKGYLIACGLYNGSVSIFNIKVYPVRIDIILTLSFRRTRQHICSIRPQQNILSQFGKSNGLTMMLKTDFVSVRLQQTERFSNGHSAKMNFFLRHCWNSKMAIMFNLECLLLFIQLINLVIFVELKKDVFSSVSMTHSL